MDFVNSNSNKYTKFLNSFQLIIFPKSNSFVMITLDKILLKKKVFWSVFSCLQTEYGNISVTHLVYIAQKNVPRTISVCEQIHSFLCICSHSLNNSLTENFIFCTVRVSADSVYMQEYNDQIKCYICCIKVSIS